MTSRTWVRVGLAYLAVVSLQIGVWAQFAPGSFYRDFPGLGRSWVSVDGPYNEHLVRDVGGLYLALAVVVVVAAVSLNRTMVRTAALATLVSGVPHFVYHLLNTAGLGAGDIAASLAGLFVFAAVPVALLLTPRSLWDTTTEAT